jgi:hypothetical protein
MTAGQITILVLFVITLSIGVGALIFIGHLLGLW